MNKLKNKIKLYFPTAINIETDEYGFTNFKLSNFKDGSFGVWDDNETMLFIYTDIVDKFKPSRSYLSCNINNREEVMQFIKDLKYCKSRPLKTRQECLDISGSCWYSDYTYLEYKREKINEVFEELLEFRGKQDAILEKYYYLILRSQHYKHDYWSSKIGKYSLELYIDNNSRRPIVDELYEYADELGIDLRIYGS